VKPNYVNGLYVVMFGCALLVTGCTTYYKVTDPESGKTYYTEDVSNKGDGAVKLKDERSQAVITLQNSAVIEITEDEYKAGLTMPAPAAAPAKAPAPAEAPAESTEPK
jgi:hypothetical protein